MFLNLAELDERAMTEHQRQAIERLKEAFESGDVMDIEDIREAIS